MAGQFPSHSYSGPIVVEITRYASGYITAQEGPVLQLALIFLVVGLVAGLLGFTSIAGASFAIAKFLAGLFLVLFLVFLILAIVGVRKVVD
jgi:uncharacterized membrane protein YtjA (UPF0391 family)